ncbi:hypothetical protein F4678DRAFT_482589 [Xylaria arbuscula]|nr:hypothetical protein F4678DRAFT_482589 [Xylaria arbuscula]
MLAFIPLMALLATPVLAQRCPAVCVSDPPLQLDAGVSNVSAVVDDSFGRQCQATIYFSDPMFLPITYHFQNISCNGLAVTSFTVPTEVPNGVGCVVWQCAGPGLVTCNNVMISGGSPKDVVQTNKNGTVGCILNTTRIQTTLVTVTSSSTTFTKVASSTLTLLTTSIQQGPPPPTASLTTSSRGTSTYLESDQHTSPTSLTASIPTVGTPSSHTSASTMHDHSSYGGSASGQGTSSGTPNLNMSTTVRITDTSKGTGSQSTAATSQGTAATSQGTAATSQGTAATGTSSISAVVASVVSTVTMLRTITSTLSACAEETNI